MRAHYINIVSRSYSTYLPLRDANSFNEWLAGVIDGDGYFYIISNKYPSLTIEMEVK